MTAYPRVQRMRVQRTSDGTCLGAVLAIGADQMAFLEIGAAWVGLFVEHIPKGVIFHLSRVEKNETPSESRVKVQRTPQGDMLGACVVIGASALRFVDHAVEWLKIESRVAENELLIRITAEEEVAG